MPNIPALVMLCAAFGQDEANHGTMRYAVGDDGRLRVPPEVALPLAANGGFAVEQPAGESASAGAARLYHAEAAGCSYGGHWYQADENGDVLVPAAAARELIAHGFVAVLPTLGPKASPGKGALRWRPAI